MFGFRLGKLGAALKKAGFNVRSLFSSGEQGAWYDPSDINLTWRRNLLTYTEQFDNAVWAKDGVTVVSTTAVSAPYGGGAINKLIPASGTSVGQLYRLITQTGTCTAFIYAKKAEWNYLRLNPDFDTAGVRSAVFNLNDGVVSAVGASATAAIFHVGNGWYQCVVTISRVGAEFNFMAQSTPSLAYNGGGAGDGTSGIYLWGAQLEAGSTATAYQKITDGVQDYYTYQAQPVLFQDSAGTTPVTAVEQPVGLMLDKSKGLVLGPETVKSTSPNTTEWSNTTTGVVVTDGFATWTSAASGARVDVSSTASFTPNKWYKVELTISSISAGAIRLTDSIGTTGRPDISSAGTSVFYILAVDYLFRLRAVGTTTAVVTKLSVRELPGNHAFQSTSTKRPLLSARKNWLVGTETLATQSVTTRAAAQVLSFYGTGTVTLSGTSTAGPLIGTGANDRVSLTFTPTAGTLTLTVSGSVTKAQLEDAT